MNKLFKTLVCSLFILLFFSTSVNSQTIVDVNLRKYIRKFCPSCLDNNGNLLDSAKKIINLTIKLDTNDIVNRITTSKGLEGFTNLKQFYFSFYHTNQYLSTSHKFDSLPPQLEMLSLFYSNFDKIDKVPSSLKSLTIYNYKGDILPKLPNSLKKLNLYLNDNSFVSFPKLPDSLQEFGFTSPYFKNIPPLPDSLMILSLSMQELVSIPILPKDLKSLGLFYTKKIKQLPVLPSKTVSIFIYMSDSLKYIPNFPDSLNLLTILSCESLTKIPPFPKNILQIKISETGIVCLPYLPNYVRTVYSDASCLPNKPPFLTDVIIGQIRDINLVSICDKNNVNNCLISPTIIGKIYYDLNNNGIQNLGEPNVKQALIKSADGNLMNITDSTGKYLLTADYSKVYTISPSLSTYFKVTPLSRTITTTAATAQRFDSLDFAIQSVGTFPDLSLSITSGNARPGFSSVSTLTYRNTGTTTLNGTITLTIDDKQTFVSADIPPTAQSGNTLTWNFSNLLPFEFKNINITFKTLVTAPLSSFAVTKVKGAITNATDVNETNNSETAQIQVRGAYDPNDIQVDKASVATINKIETTPLSYTIRFQNTGNAEALRVEVIDTLTKKLDVTAIEMLGASHPYDLQIVSDSGKVRDYTIVKWTFDGIYLPDSVSNERGSHGFIKYRIKNDTKKMGFTTDSIFNKAAIYFDFNSPVITNKVKTLFAPIVSTTELKSLGLSVFPNPTKGILNIAVSNDNIKDMVIEVINLNGQVVKSEILRGQNIQVNIQSIASGLYFLKVKTSDGIGVLKIMKE